MKVNARARLAWANRNIEAAADIIVAEYLRELVKDVGGTLNAVDLLRFADELDPKGGK
jgi:hypothetical protein